VGDALVLTPLLAALHDAGHRLGAVLSTRNSGLFAKDTFAHVHITERIPWPDHGSTSASYTRALAEIRAARYDVALIASEEPEAYEIARAAKIPRRIGFWNGLQKPLKSLWVLAQVTRVVQRNAALDREPVHEAQAVFALGAGLSPETFPTSDVARLRPLLLDEPVSSDGGVLVQLTAKWQQIGVARGALRAMLDALRERYTVTTIAPPEELDDPRTFDEYVQITRTPEAWKRAVAGAGIVVTPDTGTAHLAGMLGVPTIDVFPDTPEAAAQWARWHPWATVARQLLTRGEPEQFAAEVVGAVGLLARIFGESEDEEELE
jgi:ADP-heptose:LPS heptosyltransferase